MPRSQGLYHRRLPPHFAAASWPFASPTPPESRLPWCICCSVDYIRQVAGSRTVPVELGSRYTDEGWSQTLMTVEEFITHYLEDEVWALRGAAGVGPDLVLLDRGNVEAAEAFLGWSGRCGWSDYLGHWL